MRVLMMDVSGPEGVLTLVGEPKSPHGCDVTPDGKSIVVGGKLDTHTTLYDFAKMKTLIGEKKYEGKDPYGLPIIAFKEAISGQVEIGLGPLHTVFGDHGDAYTSVFIESTVAKWSYKDLKQPVEKLKVQYNIGHILSAEGDTVSPDGKYVVAMNKMSMDRFLPVGPLYPQNFQLIDITNEKMRKLVDMPIGNAEPHYSQMIKVDKIKPIKAYKPGTNAVTGEIDPLRAEGGPRFAATSRPTRSRWRRATTSPSTSRASSPPRTRRTASPSTCTTSTSASSPARTRTSRSRPTCSRSTTSRCASTRRSQASRFAATTSTRTPT